MENLALLPHRYKNIGWIILIPALLLGIGILFLDLGIDWQVRIPVLYHSSSIFSDESKGFFGISNINIFENSVGILIIIGGLLVGFSKEKTEDEYINSLRLKAVFWSMKINYIIFLILFLTIFGIDFLNIIFLMIYLPILLYIFKFNHLLKINQINEK